MCISNNAYPQPRVDFLDTILYGGVVQNPQGAIEHVLAYFNKVAAVSGTSGSNNSDFGWDIEAPAGDDFGWDIAPKPRKVGNAMLFAVPAVPGTMSEKNLIPVRDFPRFMQDYKRAVAPQERSMSRGAKSVSFGTLGADSAPIVVKGFDGGTYDVVIAPGGALQIAQVIAQVDEDKRPQLNEALYAELNTAYPGFTFVLFCFSEADAEQAGCAMIRYTPRIPHLLYLPGLDGHNGFIERGKVSLNHTIVLGSHKMKAGAGVTVEFTDAQLARSGNGGGQPGGMGLTAPRPTRPYYVLPRVIGRIIEDGTEAPQGDFIALVEDIEAGRLRVRRQVPPGWKNLPGRPADPANGEKWYITETSMGAQRPSGVRG